MQIRPDGFDATTLEKQFRDGVPEHQILQSTFIVDHKFPREPVDARRFLAQKEDDLATLKQRADTDIAKEETKGRTRQQAEERRKRAEKEEIEREKRRFANLNVPGWVDPEAKAKAEAEAKAKAEAEAKANAEAKARAEADARQKEADAKQEAEFRKTAKKTGRFAVGQRQ